LAIIITFSQAVNGQEIPTAEIAGVYSAITEIGGSSCNGAGGVASVNVNRWFGAVADVSGCRTKFSFFGGTATNTRFSYLVGPRVSYRSSNRLTPYAQVLIGGAHASSTLSPSGFKGNGFAMSVGIGVDLRLTSHIALRLVQPEYFRSKFQGVHHNDFRFQTGVVFRLGAKS